MELIKKYSIVISIFMLALVLVVARTFNSRQFRYDAVRWAEPSAEGSNIISVYQIEEMTGNKLVVWIGTYAAADTISGANHVSMDPGTVLEKQNLKLIRKNKGPVILCSEDISLSARIWMLLSEMGVKDLYILSNTRESQKE